MLKLRRILVPVNDLHRRTHAAALKAAQLARGSGGEIELFHAWNQLVDVYAVPDTAEAFERTEHLKILRRLESMAARLRRLGVRVTTSVESDYPAHDAIIRRAMRSRADLIVVDAHRHHRAPALLRVTDWELLRHSPVPILLVKSSRRYLQPVVIASVDPQHSFSKPTGLDRIILEAAEVLQMTLKGKLHVMHAFVPLPIYALSSEVMLNPDVVKRLQRIAERHAQAGLDRLLRDTEIPAARRHVVPVHPMEAIPRTARDLHGAIVVMGAISRSGLKRIFIGNTAEHVMDELACDVLVVKPKAFDARVPRRPRGIHWRMLSTDSL